MNSKIVAIGLANPGKPINQKVIGNFMKKAHQLEGNEARKLGFLYRKSGIDTRFSVLEDFDKIKPEEFKFFPKNENLNPFPGTKARMEIFGKEAPKIASDAVMDCLENSNTHASEITHLVLVSCTGMLAPGVELSLMQNLGLSDSIERYCIHFMGCYAAFTGLKLADKIIRAEPKAKVLVVCVELCTLHFQKDYSEDNLLANSLFGDGAAAALVSAEGKGLEIDGYMSHVLREGDEDMAWGIGDFGFEMKLTKYIPSLLDEGIHSLKDVFEKRFSISRVKNFAIHPGGKQILDKVSNAFGLPAGSNDHAMQILRNFGNMSSVTILFVLDRMMRDSEITNEILAMGFGPGLTMEVMHLNKIE